MTDLTESQLKRLRSVLDRADVRLAGSLEHYPRPWVAVVSSRLGQHLIRQRQVCQVLKRRCRALQADQGTLLAVAGTAVETWAIHAARLYHVPMMLLSARPSTDRCGATAIVEGDAVDRDALAIGLADQIAVAFVRNHGAIERHVAKRLSLPYPSNIDVFGDRNSQPVARLIKLGASAKEVPESIDVDDSAKKSAVHASLFNNHEDPCERWWEKREGWLVHCTRGCPGPWPDEDLDDFRTAMFQASRDVVHREAIDALLRIIRTGKLIAHARTSANTFPVVCFSEVPLLELLKRRCYRRHLNRWDYEPFGVALEINAARQHGICPVIYNNARPKLTPNQAQAYRFQRSGKNDQWRAEREWRSPRTIDLHQFAASQIRIFVHEVGGERVARLADCPWPVTVVSNLPAAKK